MREGQWLAAAVCVGVLACSGETPSNGGVGGASPFTVAGSAGSSLSGGSAGASSLPAGGAGVATAGATTETGGAGSAAGGSAGDAAGGSASGGTGGVGSGGGRAGGAGGAGGSGGVVGSGGDGSERPGWKLLWRDEFDGPAGSPPDATKWTPKNAKSTSNQELEYYTPRPENVSLDGNGFLSITARKESYMGAQYTSARLETENKFEQKYGRFESRIKIPRGQGIWPAFWIMGNNGEVGWPQRGELDIMENRGREPTISLGAMHGPGYSGSKDFRAEHVIAEGVWMNFHVFALEWEENVTRWYVDDELFETRTPADLAQRDPNLVWVYDHPFFILLNVAVGGLFPGAPDATTPFPQTMLVDYVRVYSRP